ENLGVRQRLDMRGEWSEGRLEAEKMAHFVEDDAVEVVFAIGGRGGGSGLEGGGGGWLGVFTGIAWRGIDEPAHSGGVFVEDDCAGGREAIVADASDTGFADLGTGQVFGGEGDLHGADGGK